MTHYEETLQRDIELIRSKVQEMGGLVERALRDSLKAVLERNRQLAYSIVLRDQRIDELEKQVDRLCLEFLVRQQPVAGHLRFAYATIKVNAELERIGDYAESVARQSLKLSHVEAVPCADQFSRIAELSLAMFHDSVHAFLKQDADLARKSMVVEEQVDVLRNQINAELLQQLQAQRFPITLFTPLMTIARRFERVSDQAKNICEEVLYMCTGQYAKHPGTEALRILFVDAHNASASQMAEAVANALRLPHFSFSSAGMSPKPVDPGMVAFLAEKGLDLTRQTPKALDQIPHLDYYQVIVALDKEAQKAFPPPPTRTVALTWEVKDPAAAKDTAEAGKAAYEETYLYLQEHIRDLTEAILGDKSD